MEGLVIKNAGNRYVVRNLDSGDEIICAIKGKFRLKDIRTTNPVAVGDVVTVWVLEVDKQKNRISLTMRRPVPKKE